jgi:hypothetical protein
MSTQCVICGNCVENCQRCPQGCEYLTIFNLNKRRINRRVRIRSSLQLFQKKSAVVSRMVGQGATPSHLLQAGGPGDLISSVEQSAPRATRAARRSVTYNKGFSMGTSKNRLSCKGSVGVDKKHGSYARFLARKTGGVLRKEQMPRVKQRKASIHQPRNRTGTAVPCCRPSHTTTTQRLKVTAVGPIVAACQFDNGNQEIVITATGTNTVFEVGDYPGGATVVQFLGNAGVLGGCAGCPIVASGTIVGGTTTVSGTVDSSSVTFLVKPDDCIEFQSGDIGTDLAPQYSMVTQVDGDVEVQSAVVALLDPGITSITFTASPTTACECCQTRIPQINTATCQLLAPDAVRWNSGNTAITGACGNNTQCVSSSRCRCCSNSRA